MKNLPQKIYLNVGPDPGEDFSRLSDVTWSEDQQFDGDPLYIRHGQYLEYLRALIDAVAWLEDQPLGVYKDIFGFHEGLTLREYSITMKKLLLAD